MHLDRRWSRSLCNHPMGDISH